jgi:Flp pilus assembly protein TadG
MAKLIRSFSDDARGTVAVMTAGMMLGALVLTGAAIDYARASAVKIALQAAVDSTAIMLAQALKTTPADQLQSQAQTYLQAAFYKSNSSEASVQVDTSQVAQQLVSVRATTVMPTTLTQVIGFANLTISATAQAIAAQAFRHRIALVLDNSGSMDDKGKMKALQSASTRFLTSLQDQATNPADIYVSVIPFNDDVNIDNSNSSAWWVDWTDWNANFDMFGRKGGTTNPFNHPSWKGCVTDRGNSLGPSGANYDTNVTAPTMGNTATYFSADNPKECPEEVMALSNDFEGQHQSSDRPGARLDVARGRRTLSYPPSRSRWFQLSEVGHHPERRSEHL